MERTRRPADECAERPLCHRLSVESRRHSRISDRRRRFAVGDLPSLRDREFPLDGAPAADATPAGGS
jgi:hypothetical protein